MKFLFQEVCALKKYDWDKPLPDEFVRKWENWVQDLENANSVVFACFYFADVMRDEQLENVGLYGFSDASKKAYCATIYLFTKTSIGYSSELLTSKTRVAPLKGQTIPRLEVLGAIFLARLMTTVWEAFDVVIVSFPVNECYLVDSTAVLFWIRIQTICPKQKRWDQQIDTP